MLELQVRVVAIAAVEHEATDFAGEVVRALTLSPVSRHAMHIPKDFAAVPARVHVALPGHSLALRYPC